MISSYSKNSARSLTRFAQDDYEKWLESIEAVTEVKPLERKVQNPHNLTLAELHARRGQK